MYSAVKSCVRYKSNISNFTPSEIGLKHGDPSLPLLFMFFVNDIFITIDVIKLFLILYADDMTSFATSQASLQSTLRDIEIYCSTWGMKINVNKAKAMNFENGWRPSADFYTYGR